MGDKVEKKEKGLKIWKCIVSVSFIILSVMLVYLLIWTKNIFGDIPFSQVLFHMMVPLEGTDTSIIMSYVYGASKWVGIASVVMVALGVIYYLNQKSKKTDVDLSEEVQEEVQEQAQEEVRKEVHGKSKENSEENSNSGIKQWLKSIILKIAKGLLSVNKFLIRRMLPVTAMVLVLVLVVDFVGFGMDDWVADRLNSSTLYEEYYVDASEADIKAPAKKKNLIFVLSESLEASYTDFENGGCMDRNYMPKLTELAKENTHFSRNESLAGAVEVEGTGWTIAAMVAQTSGVPLMLPIGRNSYGNYDEFLPGVTSMGEILEENGYVNEILIGSKREFAGVDNFFVDHGNYKIFDYYTAVEEEYVKKHNGFWGVDDEDLFMIAKDEIRHLAAGDQPFSIIVNTIDLHTPNGYLCNACGYEYDDNYKNIIACQDNQIVNFVEWCQQQDFYEDTVIVVAGDHLSMAPIVKNEYVPEGYQRSVYNAIINSDLEPVNWKNRQFTTMDMFPTILASLGFKIEGERLGLGTNLYSDKKTVMETIGKKEFMEEISKNSKLYNKDILGTR